MPGQKFKASRILGLETFGHLEAIDDHRFSSVHGVFDAGEDLQRRHRVAIWIVGVRLQPEIGIGEIVGIDLGPDVEPAPVIGLAHIAEKVHHLAQEAARAWHFGHHRKAEAAYRDFKKSYRGNVRVTDATLRAGRTALGQGATKRAADAFAAVLATYNKAKGKDRTAIARLAAEARYQQGELVFKEFEKLSLAVPQAQLTRALAAKSGTLKKAADIYLSIADYKDVKWATAALYRAGQIFDGFAEALISVPTPEGMTDDQAQAYRDTLDIVVVDTQDSAVQAFSVGYAKAIQLQAYDEYTAKIRAALGRLASDAYPPEREGRAPVRDGDRPLAIDLVTEVAR